ncbi:Fur family transcriptional regulator [Arenibaculum pallidiluteum]|uniref:Fur family transcriptional regulator n=1 Tax=Arenibaculum pallidiluteum TaxID=2812559 RepID=UPI001A9710FA|nr:Fur family transcriptional regulator [Arenibaculum pallidiluteum]
MRDGAPPSRTQDPAIERGPSRLETLCLKKGLKMTGQRRTISRVLSEAKDHPDVEEVYRRASALDDKISIATVYRTVKLLEDVGVIERLDFGDGRARFEEARDEHHHHLIDLQSGRVVEFQCEELELLKERIARDLGYDLLGHRLELYGVPLDQKRGSGE